MNQNDYIIIYDENGSPYIAHGFFSSTRDAVKGMKERAHKYLMKIQEHGVWRYFYSKDEIDAYERAKEERQQAERDLARAKYASSRAPKGPQPKEVTEAEKQLSEKQKKEENAKAAYEQMKNYRQKIEQTFVASKQYLDAVEKYHPNDSKRKSEAYQKFITYSNAYRKTKEQEEQAKQDYEKTVKEREEAEKHLELAKSSAMKDEEFRQTLRQKSVNNAQAVVDEKRDMEKTAYDATPEGREEIKDAEKKQKAYEKEQALNLENYEYRQRRGFKTGSTALWSKDKKFSSYSDDALAEKIADAVKADGVEPYSGDNPKIRSSYKSVLSSRKAYEEHAVDLAVAQKLRTEMKDQLTIAEEELRQIYDDTSASDATKREAGNLYSDLKKQYTQVSKDLLTLQKAIEKDQEAYQSAIQIYRMNRKVYGLK